MHRMILLFLLFLFGVSCQLTHPNISLPLCPKGQVRLSNKTCVNISDTPKYPGNCPIICLYNTVCINNKCQDPNNVSMCGHGLHEQDGKCVSSDIYIGFNSTRPSGGVCPFYCLNGCKDGQCAPNPTCKPGWKMSGGKCIRPPGIRCPKGRCVPKNRPPRDCPTGTIDCTPVKIENDTMKCITSKDCPADTGCQLGKCVGGIFRTPNSTPSCPEGTRWYNGRCIRRNCPKNCPPGYGCSRGVCKERSTEPATSRPVADLNCVGGGTCKKGSV